MANETPDHRKLRAAKLQAEFAEKLRIAREKGELLDADDEEERTSVTIQLPPEMAESLFARLRHSVAPASIRAKMESPKSKGAAIATAAITLLGALAGALKLLVDSGLLGP